MLSPKTSLLSGTVFGGLAVAIGAFGAHALRPLLIENVAVETYNLAAQYQFYHALALMLIGILADKTVHKTGFGWAGFCMLTGTLLFSGSLYALALTGTRSVVFITPLGGLFFLVGWAILIVAITKLKSSSI